MSVFEAPIQVIDTHAGRRFVDVVAPLAVLRQQRSNALLEGLLDLRGFHRGVRVGRSGFRIAGLLSPCRAAKEHDRGGQYGDVRCESSHERGHSDVFVTEARIVLRIVALPGCTSHLFLGAARI